MSEFFKPEVKEDVAFELVPEGKHGGVIKYVIDCGHHHDKDMKGNPIVKHLVYVAFQFPRVLTSDGQPHYKGDFFTATDFKKSKGYMWNENSKFNKYLRSWTGEPKEKVQWVSFLADLVARDFPAYVTIEHTKAKDSDQKYSNIISVKPYDGESISRVGPFLAWGIGEDGFEELPHPAKKKIRKSIEWTGGGNPSAPGAGMEEDDMDLPF